MAGTMRKVAEYLGLVEVDEYEEGDLQERTYETTRAGTGAGGYSTAVEPAAPVAPRPVAPQLPPAPAYQRIITVQPHIYNDAKRIGEDFRTGTPVILNLTEMSDPDAKRIIDFSSGLAFGLHGTIEKIAKNVFLLSPANVELGPEIRQRIAQDGFFNQS